jgi:Fe-S cluster biogenesis protein NfuA
MEQSTALAKIEQAIDQVRPTIQLDGGDLELVKYEDGIVYVRLHGACTTCPASIYTLKLGVEAAIKELLPEVQEVVEVE